MIVIECYFIMILQVWWFHNTIKHWWRPVLQEWHSPSWKTKTSLPHICPCNDTLILVISLHLYTCYIQAVSGRFLNTSFDPVTSKFSLTFEADTSIKSTSDCLIYLNEKLYYPNGYNVMYVLCTCFSQFESVVCIIIIVCIQIYRWKFSKLLIK